MTQLLQNALCGTALILAAAVLRGLLKDRLIPEIRLALWLACLLRLLTPVSPASMLSLWALPRRLADAAPIQGVPGPSAVPGIPSPPAVQGVPNPSAAPVPIPVSGTLPSAAQPAPALSLGAVLLAIWAAVGAALAVWYVLAWRRTRRAVRAAAPVPREDPRYARLPRCARLREGPMEGAPLTFGALRPTVVLAPGLSGDALECVLAHEGTHARRRDNLWHYAMALVQVLFWWDPAVWLMARLLRRDVELACDRAALRRLGPDRRKEYALALVSIATKNQAKGSAFCHTFGRKAAKERIRWVMNYKKLSVLGLALSLLLVCGVTVTIACAPKPAVSADEPAAPADGTTAPTDEPAVPSGPVAVPRNADVLDNGYPVNQNGETYGHRMYGMGLCPDLKLAQSADGVLGYVRCSEADAAPGEFVNLYREDGVTVIGQFWVVPPELAQEIVIPSFDEVRANGYPVNQNGETYGPAVKDVDASPDLQLAESEDGVTGYVRWSESRGNVATPEEAIAYMEEYAAFVAAYGYFPGHFVNLYLEDGVTVIGQFWIGEA